MGARGPVPKRKSQRRGHRSKAEKEKTSTVVVEGDVAIPPAQKTWHRAARALYESIGTSGQAKFMEPSDWQAAQLAAQTTSMAMRSKPPSAEMMKLAWKMWEGLAVTESQRRRAAIEIERTPHGGAGDKEPDQISDHRSRLTVIG